MRLKFLRPTGLGDQAAEAGQIVDVFDLARAREFVALGRAIPAPEENPHEPSPAVVIHDPESIPSKPTTTKGVRR